MLTKSLVNWIKLVGHHHRAIQSYSQNVNSIYEGQKTKGLSWACLLLFTIFYTKGIIIIIIIIIIILTPQRHEIHEGPKRPKNNNNNNKSKPSSWAHFCSQFMHKRILKQYGESLVSSSGEWSTNTRVAMAYAHKLNPYNIINEFINKFSQLIFFLNFKTHAKKEKNVFFYLF